MLAIEDNPTQRKIGEIKQSSKSACKRCKMLSQLQDDKYVYGKNLV
jgi:hypothetical protein